MPKPSGDRQYDDIFKIPLDNDRKYKIIYADPAWDYRQVKVNGAAKKHYKTVPFKKLLKLEPVINALADKNCILLMWVPGPQLDKSIDLIREWKFQYKTIGFIWKKSNRYNQKPFFGLGSYTRSNGELVLLARRGKMLPIRHDISQIVEMPVGKHSAKPDKIREYIELMFGDVPRIELFARDWADGWDVVGNDKKLKRKRLHDYK